jgi:hypothetical protein
MARYVVVRIHADRDGWVNEAFWRQTHGPGDQLVDEEKRVSSAQILAAMGRGDQVQLIAKHRVGAIVVTGLLERVETAAGWRLRLQPEPEGTPFRVERY